MLTLWCGHSTSRVYIEKKWMGAPGWLGRRSVRLRLRSRSRGWWVRAPRRALCWQLGACSLLGILCLPLFLPLPCSCSVSLCLSITNKLFQKIKKKKKWMNVPTEDTNENIYGGFLHSSKHWKQPKCLPTTEQIVKSGRFIQQNTVGLWKRALLRHWNTAGHGYISNMMSSKRRQTPTYRLPDSISIKLIGQRESE